MGRSKNIGLTAKLVIAVVLCSVVTFLVVFGIGYSLTDRVVTSQVNDSGENVIDTAVNNVDDVVDVVARTTKSVNFAIQNSMIDKVDLFRVIKFILSNNQELSGLSISFEPFAANPKEKFFSPYCYKNGEDVKCEMIGSDKFDYFNMDWYKDTKATRKASWTDPYFDDQCSNIFILSHSAPIYKDTEKGKVFYGVVSADISLDWLQDTISRSAADRGGYAFLISKHGTFISFPKEGFSLKKTIWDVANENDDNGLNDVANKMTSGKTGIGSVKDIISGESSWIFYKPVQMSGWSIGVVFTAKKLYADVMYIANRMIALCILGMIFLSATVYMLSRRITKPLTLLSKAAGQISHGNLDTNIPAVTRRDEVGELARSFTAMQMDLKKYINELTETVTKQERITNELKIAHDIQQSIVPEEFPSFGLAGNVHAFGKLVPAREVGGDLYDCYEMDERRTLFVVGDVSDKGVHAAMIMAIVSTLLRGLSKNLHDPDKMMGIVNRQVLKRNRESMFVTMFCGILNNETGEFRFTNAGHVPPVIIRKGRSPELLTERAGTPLGINANTEYVWETIKFSDGDKLFMYTDGVTDALDDKGELFGDERLLDILKSEKRGAPEELVNGVFDAVKKHALDRPLPDDIALLCFSFAAFTSNNKNCLSLSVPNSADEIPKVAAKLREFGAKYKVGSELLDELNLALEEVMINITRYGHQDQDKHTIDIGMEILNDNFIVKITDDGKPFDPSMAAHPNTALSVEERPIGGLGIFLAKKLTDKLYYERIKDRNQLTLVKIIK